MSSDVEQIILSHDRRGISRLRDYLPPDFCHDAAVAVIEAARNTRRRAIITTGFYVASARAPETDGPPGAIAIGRALELLGLEVIYITDKQAVPLLSDGAGRTRRVVDFPIADHDESRRLAQHILADVRPSLIISIERCGLNGNKQYLNMAGADISAHTAKIDYLFLSQRNSIGIGDGGNEIGMGNLAPHIPKVQGLPQDPALTPVNKLVIASISNWGGYGLLAALSRLVGRNLLPSVEWEKETISEMVSKGAVDGVSGQRQSAVDGFDLDQNAWALERLHGVLAPIS